MILINRQITKRCEGCDFPVALTTFSGKVYVEPIKVNEAETHLGQKLTLLAGSV